MVHHGSLTHGLLVLGSRVTDVVTDLGATNCSGVVVNLVGLALG